MNPIGSISGYQERPLAEVQRAELLEFMDAILKGEFGLQARTRLARSIREFSSEFRPERELFVALYRKETLRAVIAVDRSNDARAILRWFFVRPQNRGRGLGSRLLSRAIRFARDAGYSVLALATMDEMAAARHLYEKNDFAFKRPMVFWRKPMLLYEKTL